jgi:hypothetical protein
MEFNYKLVNLYYDEKIDSIYAIPTGRLERIGIVDIEVMEKIEPPYDSNILLQKIEKALSLCFSLTPQLPSKGGSVIAKLLEKKTYNAATKGKKLIVLLWEKDSGYKIFPTKKESRGGYTYLYDAEIAIGETLDADKLFRAVKRAIDLSTTN